MEMREYVSDLYEWEQEMQLKEKMRNQLKKEERNRNSELAKIAKESEARENKIKAQESRKAQQQNEQTEKKKDLVRDTNTIKDYYKAWDKFDVDKEL